MKIINNIEEVAKLRPDFMGFIFWSKTKDFFLKKKFQFQIMSRKLVFFVNQDLDLIKKVLKNLV